MSWLQLLGIAGFSVLCWLHGYTRARTHTMPELLRLRKAYWQGRRDERADNGKEPV